jgi:hypothetical protein
LRDASEMLTEGSIGIVVVITSVIIAIGLGTVIDSAALRTCILIAIGFGCGISFAVSLRICILIAIGTGCGISFAVSMRIYILIGISIGCGIGFAVSFVATAVGCVIASLSF